MIIFISGCPGTGKTTVSLLFSFKYGFSYININSVAGYYNYYIGRDLTRDTQIIDTNRLRRKISSLLRYSEFRDVVIDGHIASAVPRNIDRVVVLRLHPLKLFERLRLRGYPRDKIRENVEAEFIDVCGQEALNRFEMVYEIDVTDKSPMEVSEEIFRIVKERRRGRLIDWMDRLGGEDVEKLFRLILGPRQQGTSNWEEQP